MAGVRGDGFGMAKQPFLKAACIDQNKQAAANNHRRQKQQKGDLFYAPPHAG